MSTGFHGLLGFTGVYWEARRAIHATTPPHPRPEQHLFLLQDVVGKSMSGQRKFEKSLLKFSAADVATSGTVRASLEVHIQLERRHCCGDARASVQ